MTEQQAKEIVQQVKDKLPSLKTAWEEMESFKKEAQWKQERIHNFLMSLKREHYENDNIPFKSMTDDDQYSIDSAWKEYNQWYDNEHEKVYGKLGEIDSEVVNLLKQIPGTIWNSEVYENSGISSHYAYNEDPVKAFEGYLGTVHLLPERQKLMKECRQYGETPVTEIQHGDIIADSMRCFGNVIDITKQRRDITVNDWTHKRNIHLRGIRKHGYERSVPSYKVIPEELADRLQKWVEKFTEADRNGS